MSCKVVVRGAPNRTSMLCEVDRTQRVREQRNTEVVFKQEAQEQALAMMTHCVYLIKSPKHLELFMKKGVVASEPQGLL